jgi:hypothetical protein
VNDPFGNHIALPRFQVDRLTIKVDDEMPIELVPEKKTGV